MSPVFVIGGDLTPSCSWERILLRLEPWQMETTLEELQAEVGRVLNQKEKLAAFRGRTLVLHTLRDDIVPVRHGELLHGWANRPKELVIFDRGDHNNIREVNRERYYGHLGKFLRSCEGKGEGPSIAAEKRI